MARGRKQREGESRPPTQARPALSGAPIAIETIILSFPQTRCVYSNLVGKRLDRGRLNKIATPDELAPAASSRRDAAETVFLDEFTVTDEPRWNGGYCPLRAVHADDEFVV